MNKGSTNRTQCGASGLRRSAIVERRRLREEWSALKEIPHNLQDVNEVLRGVVVLVDVGSESRALPLRAALTALGATVAPAWSPLVTHLVWSQGGCRSTRAKARALACRLVSPLWVEACAAEGRKLSERIFPAASRPSDLPSPATLRKFLKKAEAENIPLHDLLFDSQDGEKQARPRLRLSSETSRETSRDESRDATDVESRVNTARRRPADPVKSKPIKSKRKLFTQKETSILSTDESDDDTTAGPKKIQTQPTRVTQRDRRDLAKAERMARQLMGATKDTQTHKQTPASQGRNKAPRIVLTGMSTEERREAWLAIKQLNGKVQKYVDRKTTHVIMGLCHEKENNPPTKTTSTSTSGNTTESKGANPITMCNKCNSPRTILKKLFRKRVTVETCPKIDQNDKNVICKCHYDEISGIKNISDVTCGDNIVFPVELRCDDRINLDSHLNAGNGNNYNIQGNDNSFDILGQNLLGTDIENGQDCDVLAPTDGLVTEKGQNNNLNSEKPRTLNALLGAARGCHILTSQWLKDSLKENKFLYHIGYEVKHFKKLSQKARAERSALNKMNADYAYDVFNGMRVKISPDADQKDAVTQLLTLCGAVVTDDVTPTNKHGGSKQDGAKVTFRHLEARTQNGGQIQNGGVSDLTIGQNKGEVNSKWVFDSVVAARMRTTRRYVND